jgi:hypothetical protein
MELLSFKLYEAIIDWRSQELEDFEESVLSARLPISTEEFAEIGAEYGIEIVDYDTFYAELSDAHRESAPPRGVPAFATVNPDTLRPRVIVNVPRIDMRLFDYIFHMLKHEMVHVGQWSRRAVQREGGPNPTDRTAYFSDKDEIMAFSQSIVDQMIKMGARSISQGMLFLPQIRLYLDIRKAVEQSVLNRYHKYIYLYLEQELADK